MSIRSVFVCAMVISGLLMHSAKAQDYPSRPVRFIVPNASGTLVDILARTLAPEIGKGLGQSVIVEAKPGADSVIGLEYVARQSPADGYTVAVALVSTSALLPVMVKDLRFDPIKDLPPVIGLAEGRFVFGSPSGNPWKTFNEFVAYAKDNPGKLNYGSAVPVVRVLIEAITRAHGLNVIYIPYTAYAPLQQALLAGEIQMSFVAQANVDAMGEKFRVLAVTGDSRLLSFPNVPMFKELGFDKIRGISYSLNVRAGTPKAAIDKLHAATSRALQEPEVRAQLTKLRLEVINEGPEAATRALNEAVKFYGDVALQIGLKPQ